MKKLRVAFIGMDHIHVQTIAADFMKYPEQAEIVGIADYPTYNATQAAYKKAHNFPKQDLTVWEDYKELLAQKIDIAVVTTNVRDHAACAVEILGMNIHTVVEKPMAFDLQDARRMIEAYHNSRAELIINWPIAWFPAFRKAKELYDAGTVGKLLRVQYRTTTTRGPYPLAAHTEEELRNMWWYQHEKGGGAMRDYTGYGCVLTTWFVGKPAERVMGIKKNFLQPFCDCEDYATFTLDFGDSVGFLEGSWSTGHGGNLATGPIVYGSEGIIVADRYDSWVRVYLDPRLHPDAPSPYLAVETAPLADNIAKNVLDFVRNGTPLFEMITADFNLKAMVAFDAGIRSCENGQVEVCEVP